MADWIFSLSTRWTAIAVILWFSCLPLGLLLYFFNQKENMNEWVSTCRAMDEVRRQELMRRHQKILERWKREVPPECEKRNEK